jgi:hypothetical protein
VARLLVVCGGGRSTAAAARVLRFVKFYAAAAEKYCSGG